MEAWSEITLLAPICYLIKTSWSKDTWIYTLIRASVHCLCMRVERTNSEDWSAYTPVTLDQRNISQIILQKLKKNAASKIHLSYLNASMAKIEMAYS